MAEKEMKNPEDMSLEELEALMYGDQISNESADSSEVSQETSESEESSQETEELPDTETEEVTEETQELEEKSDSFEETTESEVLESSEELEKEEKKPRTNWKKRFTNYKRSTDQTIFTLRTELSDLKKQLVEANRIIQKLQQSTSSPEDAGKAFDSLFTEEQKEILGEEGIEAIKATVLAATEPLKEKLTKQEQDNLAKIEHEAKREKELAYQNFLNNLAFYVPDYEEINVDPKFLEFLDAPDGLGGFKRKDLFSAAEKAGDAAAVAKYFLAYKKEKEGKKVSKKAKIEKHLTPSGTGSFAPTASQKKDTPVITESFIENFYRDVIRGKYTKKEADRIESMIDKAVMEGSVMAG